MKKICVKIGARNNLKHIYAYDLAKIYYIKKKVTPRLPPFEDEISDFEESNNNPLLISARLD